MCSQKFPLPEESNKKNSVGEGEEKRQIQSNREQDSRYTVVLMSDRAKYPNHSTEITGTEYYYPNLQRCCQDVRLGLGGRGKGEGTWEHWWREVDPGSRISVGNIVCQKSNYE